jgi:hypothetical protein
MLAQSSPSIVTKAAGHCFRMTCTRFRIELFRQQFFAAGEAAAATHGNRLYRVNCASPLLVKFPRSPGYGFVFVTVLAENNPSPVMNLDRHATEQSD